MGKLTFRAFSASFLALASAFFAPFFDVCPSPSPPAVDAGLRAGSVGTSFAGSDIVFLEWLY